MALKAGKKTVKLKPSLADNIGARYLISGSLRQAGETIRISVKLTDTLEIPNVTFMNTPFKRVN